MSETQGNTTQHFHSCHIKGESVPLWVPSVMALLGIISSIFIAQSLLPTRLQIADLPTVQNKPREQPRITKQQRTKARPTASRAGTSALTNALPRMQEQISKNSNQQQRPPALKEKNAVLAKATAKAIPGNAKAKPARQLTANPPAQRTVSPVTPSMDKQTPAIATAETHGSISGNPIQVAANVAKKPPEVAGTTFPQASEITGTRTSKPPATGTERAAAMPQMQEQLSKNSNQHQRPPSLVEKNAALAKAPTTAKAIPGNARPLRQLTANLPAQRTVSPTTPSTKIQAPAIATAEMHGSIPEKPIPAAANVAKKPAQAADTTFPQASKITGTRTSKPPATGTERAAAMSPQAAPTEKITSVTTQHAATTRHPSHPRDCPALFFISFPIGSETPRMQHLSPKIRRLQSWLKQHPGKKVIIEGHTDAYGPEEFNLLLSYRRAKAAEGILLEAGIPGNQLLVRALGEEEPVPGLPAKSRKNRVASIRVETPQGCINNFINGDIN